MSLSYVGCVVVCVLFPQAGYIISKKRAAVVFAPRHRYQVMGQILDKAGAPKVEWLWNQLHLKEHQLWQIWPTGKYTL